MSEGDQLIDVHVATRRQSGSTIVVDLVAADGRTLPSATAGAHVDVHLATGLVRQYSLCNDPHDAGFYRLGILRDPQSRGGSIAAHDMLTPGASVRIGAPRNHFALTEDADDVVLLAGGIGITPLIAMAWRLHRIGVSFALHYCVRSLDVAPFVEDLRSAPFAERVFLHRDDGPPEQRLDLDEACGSAAPRRHLFACGPTGFIDYVVAHARSHGWSDATIHFERFTADVDQAGAAFTIHASRTGTTVAVAAGQTIVDALRTAGIAVPVSCEQGVCGTCLTRVLDGVPDHRDSYLMEDERDANDVILPCCSRAKTPVLVLDL